MKRSVAIVLTAVIFAAITVCFLRPAPSPFGYPRPILEPSTRLTLEGDTEYFEYAEVLYVDYETGTITLTLPPVYPYTLLIGAHIDEEHGMTGVEKGYIEKFVGGKWVYLCETGLGGFWTQEGGPPSYFSLVHKNSLARSKYGQHYRLSAYRILLEPGDYRYNLNFRQIEGNDKEVGDVITISFGITTPKPTSRQLEALTSRG